MVRRIDVLGDGASRLSAFTGTVLSRELDVELQACVEQAANELAAPIALVSLFLKRTMVFKAHYGLPPELEVAGAVDSDLSFCQFVVRDAGPFEVTDASSDDRPPTELADRYGIAAYLGTPVSIGSEVVGALCVLDQTPREFSPADRLTLDALARRVSARLEKLARMHPPARDQLVADGFRPAFAEIRNQLMPLVSAADEMRILVAELAPLVALGSADLPVSSIQRGLCSLKNSGATLDGLGDLADELEDASSRLYATINAVQEVATDGAPRTELRSIASTGLELAAHTTRLVGPVEVGDIPEVRVWCSLSVGASLLSVVGATLATHSTGPLKVAASRDGEHVELIIVGESIDDLLIDHVLDDIARLTTEIEHVDAAGTGSGVRLIFQAV